MENQGQKKSSQEGNKEKKGTGLYNKFILNELYPEVKNLFDPRIPSLDLMKSSCIVVLDTNVLLVPYKISSESLNNIGIIYNFLNNEKRLFVPAQVVREFAKNRGSKLGELKKGLLDYNSSRKIFSISKYPLLESFAEFNEIKQLEVNINKMHKEYSRKLDSIIKKIDSFSWDDPVSMLYGNILNDAIKEINISNNDLEDDLDRRSIHNIPPGYKDKGKEDGGIGDLIIWHTILSLGEELGRHLLFVTNEEKSDWWYRNGDAVLYPRYELVDEYRRISKGKAFHMTHFSTFLSLFDAKAEVVEEIKKEEYKDVEVRTYLATNTYLKRKAITLIDEFRKELNVFLDLVWRDGQKMIIDFNDEENSELSVEMIRIYNAQYKDRFLELRNVIISRIPSFVSSNYINVRHYENPSINILENILLDFEKITSNLF